MKFWIKIVVALCVVVIIVFGVWAFFFREKDTVKAYNQTTQLVDYKESLGVKEKLVKLYYMDYMHDDPTKKINNTDVINRDILTIRKDCLSVDDIVGYEGDSESYRYDSYFTTDKTIDAIIRYYLPYTRGNYSSNTHQKALSNAIKNYISVLSSFNQTIDDLIKCQISFTGDNAVEMDVLRGYYNTFYFKYKDLLNKSSIVTIALTDYINMSLYNGSMMADSRIALYDCYARALKVATSTEENSKVFYLHDLHAIKDKMDKINDGINIYDTTYTEYRFLTSFNNLFCNYRKALNLIFDKSHLEKRIMANGEGLSDIVNQAKDSVIVLLNVLGF